jgi:hypothetical protein
MAATTTGHVALGCGFDPPLNSLVLSFLFDPLLSLSPRSFSSLTSFSSSSSSSSSPALSWFGFRSRTHVGGARSETEPGHLACFQVPLHQTLSPRCSPRAKPAPLERPALMVPPRSGALSSDLAGGSTGAFAPALADAGALGGGGGRSSLGAVHSGGDPGDNDIGSADEAVTAPPRPTLI